MSSPKSTLKAMPKSMSKPMSKPAPQSAPKHFWIFIIAAGIELLVGLGVSVWVGMSHSWLYAALLAVGFFISANVMFMIAYKKLG